MTIANFGRLCLLSFLLSGLALAQDQPSVESGDENHPSRPTIGLVLSGGGARGAAHVGVIRILDELRIPVDYIAGTSMGAIVGGLYASGMSADELDNVIESADWSVLLADRPPRAERSFRRKTDDYGYLVDFEMGVDKTGLVFSGGIVQGQNLENALKRLAFPAISINDFDKLPIPFRAVATNIVSGEAVILESGDLGSQEFQRSIEAVQLGLEKAREYQASLAKLSVSDEEYLAYRKGLELDRSTSPVIDRVVIETESKLSPKVIEARLTDPLGKPLDIDQLDDENEKGAGYEWHLLKDVRLTTGSFPRKRESCTHWLPAVARSPPARG
jgi:hypothetical protein